jgi:hypothetical protein
VLPELAAHVGTPSVLFFGNNAAGPQGLSRAFGGERVLLGFPGAAGVTVDGRIRYLVLTAHGSRGVRCRERLFPRECGSWHPIDRVTVDRNSKRTLVSRSRFSGPFGFRCG